MYNILWFLNLRPSKGFTIVIASICKEKGENDIPALDVGEWWDICHGLEEQLPVALN